MENIASNEDFSKLSKKELIELIGKYFTPSNPAIDNYIDRLDIDSQFLNHLYVKGLQIIVYGPTGVGKSSLVWSQLESEEVTYFRFPFENSITVDNFCDKLMQSLGFNKLMQNSETKENHTEESLSLGAKIFTLIDFKGVLKAGSKKETEKIIVPYHNEADLDTVVTALQSLDCILFLDDVEKTSPDLRKIIAHLGKKLSDSSAKSTSSSKVIYVGISKDVNRLIDVDQSLRHRLAELKINTVATSEIKRILVDGWDNLKLEYESIDLVKIAILCCGFPRYAHWIGGITSRIVLSNSRKSILSEDISKAINEILTIYGSEYKKNFELATNHKSGDRLREKILYAIASSDEDEVGLDYILEKCSEYNGSLLKSTQISGPLGELKKEKRGFVLETGSSIGFHRFTDLMMKPYVRIVMDKKGIWK